MWVSLVWCGVIGTRVLVRTIGSSKWFACTTGSTYHMVPWYARTYVHVYYEAGTHDVYSANLSKLDLARTHLPVRTRVPKWCIPVCTMVPWYSSTMVLAHTR